MTSMELFPSRPSSNGSGSQSSGSVSMAWMMDHFFYPDGYIELPLRTTYILNSNPQSTPGDFKTLLMDHISSLPSNPVSLPVLFLSNFIRKCFPRDIKSVDFDQALTALDYMKNLDDRRKRELSKVTRKVGVDSTDIRVQHLGIKVEKIDALYGKTLLGIRRWIMIKELQTQPFKKVNCIAMLNTLYPIDEPQINSYLTSDILAKQRHAVWRYVVAREKAGPAVVKSMKTAVRGGWAHVSGNLHSYLTLAAEIIQECEEICRPYSNAGINSRTSSFSIETESVIERPENTLDKIITQLGNLDQFSRSHRQRASTLNFNPISIRTSSSVRSGSPLTL